MTIGTVEPVDYAQVSALAADVAALRDDIVGNARFAHYGNLSTAASVTVVESTVTTAIDELADLDLCSTGATGSWAGRTASRRRARAVRACAS